MTPPIPRTSLGAIVSTLLFAALPGPDARASLVHHADVDLAKVVELANLVVVARPLSPFRTAKPLVLRAGKKETTVQAVRYRFSVLRVLKSTVTGNKPVRAGRTIEVAPADEEISRSMAQAYLEGSPVPSPILSRYKIKTPLNEAARQKKLLLFLSWYPPAKNPRFVVVTSYELPGKLGAVMRLLEARPRRPSGKPGS